MKRGFYLVSWFEAAPKIRTDFQVTGYDSAAALGAAVTAVEAESRKAMMLTKVEDLVGAGGAFLLGVFNSLTGKTQKSFHDLDTARRQVWEALISKYPPPATVEPTADCETQTDNGEAPFEVEMPEGSATQEATMATKKVTKTAKKSPATKTAKAKSANGGPKKVGVIDAIVSLLEGKGGTITQMAEKLAAKFPDRDADGLRSTLKIQVNRLSKPKAEGGRGLKIKRESIEGTNELHYFI